MNDPRFTNEPRVFLVSTTPDDVQVLTDLGCTPDQAQRIAENGWSIVWAQRPIPHIAQDATGQYQDGVAWEAFTSAGHGFFAAGDPDWTMPNGDTLAQAWNRLDAFPLQIVSQGVIETWARAACEKYGYDYDEYVEMYDGNFLRVAANVGYTVHDKVARR